MTAHLHSLLVVDDDTAMREMLASLFREKGYPVQEAASADEALERAREAEFDAVLSDVRMPGRSGVELVGELRRFRPDVPVVLMTAFGSVDSAVDAMRAGAYDYITKPFEPEAVLLTLERALERRQLEEENRRLRRVVATSTSLGDLKGESPALAEIVALIRKVAGGSSNVLITGESGTGKEVVARTLHYHGARAKQPFVPINCTALPEGLLESELFGHVRGAFTGAHRLEAWPLRESRRRDVYSSTRSVTWARRSRASCCAYCRIARSAPSVATLRSKSTCASSQPRTRSSKPRWRQGASGKISTTDSM